MTIAKKTTRIAPSSASPETIGRSSPLGATVVDGGVNFSLFSRTATGVELLLFDREDDAQPVPRRSRSIRRRTGPTTTGTRSCRACSRADLRLSRRGAVRPGDAGCGSIPPRCCSTRTAAAWSSRRTTTARPRGEPGDNAATAMKSVVVDPGAYDWEGDAPLRRPSARTIIYEMHVRGFTRHPSSGVGGEDPRHLRRADREDPLPAGARHHRRRAAAGVPVRRPGLPAGPGQLLGLSAGLVLRAAPGLQLAPATRSARSTSSATW